MTFRARPVVKRVQRPSWDSRDRRNFYLNLGFGLAVVAAVVILGIAVVLSYYNDHLAPVGSVNGQSITKDELRDRVRDRGLAPRDRRAAHQHAGRRRAADPGPGRAADPVHRSAAPGAGAELARAHHRQPDPGRPRRRGRRDASATSDIDAKLLEEATTPEIASRLADRGQADARRRSGRADRGADGRRSHHDRQGPRRHQGRQEVGGRRPDRVHRQRRPRRRRAISAGWPRRTPRLDEAFMTAAVRCGREHADRRRRGRGRHLPDRPGDRDRAGGRRRCLPGDARQRRHRPREVPRRRPRRRRPDEARGQARRGREQARSPARDGADLPEPGDGRPSGRRGQGPPHPVLAEGRCRRRRATARSPPDDPSWGQAKLDADAAYARLKNDVDGFDALAREESDEESARGPQGSGGVLEAYVSADSSYVPSRSRSRSSTPSRPMASCCRRSRPSSATTSSRSSAMRPTWPTIKRRVDRRQCRLRRDRTRRVRGPGGVPWWRSRLDRQGPARDAARPTAIFAAPIGKTSDVVTVEDDGQYLFLVTAEEERTAEGRQLEEIRSRLFSRLVPAQEGCRDDRARRVDHLRDGRLGRGAGRPRHRGATPVRPRSGRRPAGHRQRTARRHAARAVSTCIGRPDRDAARRGVRRSRARRVTWSRRCRAVTGRAAGAPWTSSPGPIRGSTPSDASVRHRRRP